MIGVQDVATRAREIDAFGADYIGTHTGYDLQTWVKIPLKPLISLRTMFLIQRPQSLVELN